ncbi:putative membrane protein [Prevotella denticola CRIS 18C-A]|uniref:Putative membrane protein n=1 Tax=Prevotella denticola CRIS 18C-A TaxID=944557 RepID=F0H5T8_9BACT|nr:DUF2339 domain-containing protein [Prevotella denticola]EGC86813.1 putative membrane protein [Prevotella denticola CRIS 18C-A]
MDFGFIWILFLAFLGIPAVICFLLVSKINALGDSLDTIHEEISALQQMMRENRKKEERKPAGPASDAKMEKQVRTAEKVPAEPQRESEKTAEVETVQSQRSAVWWQQLEATRSSVVEIPVEKSIEKTQDAVRQGAESVGQKSLAAEQPASLQDRKPSMVMERPVSSSAEEATSDGVEDEASGKETNYEKFIGENLFGKIGILVFIIGIGFFVKYAIDQNWINETARTILGYAVGAGMLVLAERLHRRYHAFSSLLAGGAFGVFYLITAIAFHYYELFSQTVSFIILCATTVFMSVVSILYDRRELAVTALVGGFLAPFIVSTDSGSIITLQTYISILNVGMFCLAMYKKWGILPVVAFCFTYIILWMTTLTSGDLATPVCYIILLAFATLFYLIFLLPVIFILRTQCSGNMRRAMLTVVTADSFLYLLYGNYVLEHCDTTFAKDGFIAFFIAVVNLAVYLYLRFRIAGQNTLRNFMLALTITFVSIGIPMQFDTANLVMLWAAEAVLLLWLFTREKDRIFEVGAVVLSLLTIASLLFYRLLGTPLADPGESLFLNGNFLVMLFISAVAFVVAIILQRNRELFSEDRRLIAYSPCNAVAYAVGFGILYVAFWDDFHIHVGSPVADYASLLSANVLLCVGAFVLRNRFGMDRYKVPYDVTVYLAAGLYAAAVWNNASTEADLLRWIMTFVTIAYLAYVMRGLLLAMPDNRNQHTEFAIIATLVWLTGTRLLVTSFHEENFSTAFSLSLGLAAFILMCAGMRYHSKEVRIVSLAEFGIVLGKLIFNDVWTMSALGKIIVFISLGILLLTLSFLYQKLKDVLFNEDEVERE